MRFDDMIATVLEQGEGSPAAIAAKWRQLVDLIAQRRAVRLSDQALQALDWLRAFRLEVPADTRCATARSFSGRRVSAAAVAFFAEDKPTVAGPLISGALLTRDEWIALLPSLTPTARALLRHRRDLGPDVEHALASFGPADFALSGTVAPVAAAEVRAPSLDAGETQIRDLVARIENFRRHREAVAPSSPSEPPQPRATGDFQWEAGADGIIVWVEGAPRGPLIGQSIASIADRGQFGVDGQAAGAFEKRAPFRDARFSVAGTGAVSGDWRISGVPFFDPVQGSFLGYRGSARRPRVDEVAHGDGAAGKAGLYGTNLPADSLRQLIHELRTPLNAIVGFAEMIDGQYMGPAAASYRGRASEIMEQAGRLLSAVDDLDTAARIETRVMQFEEAPVDAVSLLCRLHDAYERVARQRGSRIAIEIEKNLPAAKVELAAAERMFARMLAATIGLAQEGEVIAATMGMGTMGAQRMLCLAIDRPHAIDGLDERALLDPGYSPDGDWPGAPALGLGFALRLVRNLAEAVGGALIVGGSRFFLYLPPEGPAELSSGQQQ
ncbi:HAMP domain-containing sensor histidine kinase [Sphingosinicella sp. BN140058]|uniref:sensor histidine kinase n=1 Tax=Sphingosinicella sp. BN140058 TaxID=1892855 RepID=UPI00101333F5|nr:HAMP domain-containing sensor histidine kinase [Sphingosinicella sp. BN140058]QAY79283.1 HAMP domain-containing histidine kinase [Sphingosinicella sp. BN140058]